MDSDIGKTPCSGQKSKRAQNGQGSYHQIPRQELGETKFNSTLQMYFTIIVGTSYCIYKIQNPWIHALPSEGLTGPSDAPVTCEDGPLNGGLLIATDDNTNILAHSWLHCKMPECTLSNSKEPGPCMINWQAVKNVMCVRFCPQEQLLASATFKRTTKGFSWETTSKMQLLPNDERYNDAIEQLVQKKHGTEYILAKRMSFDEGHFGRMELHGNYHNFDFYQSKKVQFDRDFSPLRSLGGGAFGNVQMCTCSLDNNIYAVKVLRPLYGVYKEPWEVIVLSVLNNTNIIHMKLAWRESDSGNTPYKITYVVMECCDRSVASLLPFLPGELSRKNDIFEQFIASLVYLHLKGGMHRDLKPENMLLLGNVLKLADFGEAVLKTAPDSSFQGCKIGTKGYIAPELQIISRKHTEKVDMHSAGITYYVIHCKRSQSIMDIWNLSEKICTKGLCRTDPEFDDWTGDYDLLQVMIEPDQEKRISAAELLKKLSARRQTGLIATTPGRS